ncbi:hypothetical protein EPN96_11115 [bacterium]|nr:MAG: hypothetical protein EPN96_11115 [bacterium]
MKNHEEISTRLESLVETGVRGALVAFMVVILGAIAFTTLNTAKILLSFSAISVEELSRGIMLNSLSILAMVEIYRTAKIYFSEGRVKVTYIIDSVLVTVLTEILGFWYKEMSREKLVAAVILVLVLGGIRVLAVRFSPNRREFTEVF